MTPAEAITLTLNRVGLDPNVSTYRAQALIYLNATLQDINSRPGGGWWFRFKSGTFTTIASQRDYSLASDVMVPLDFLDRSNNRPLQFVTRETIGNYDPNNDDTGNPKLVYLVALDTTTGYMKIQLYPTPTATGDTIAYNYYANPTTITSASDTTDFGVYGLPAILQPAVWLGTAKLYLQEKQDLEAAVIQQNEYEKTIQAALTTNSRMRGNMRLRLGRLHSARHWASVPVYTPEEGSLG